MDYKYQEALSQVINLDPPKKFEHDFFSYMKQQLRDDHAKLYPDCQIYRISGLNISCRRYEEGVEDPDNTRLINANGIYVKYDEAGDGLGDGFHILNGDYKGWYIYDDYESDHNWSVKIDQVIDADAFELLSDRAGVKSRIKEIESSLDEYVPELEEELDSLNDWLEEIENAELEEDYEM